MLQARLLSTCMLMLGFSNLQDLKISRLLHCPEPPGRQCSPSSRNTPHPVDLALPLVLCTCGVYSRSDQLR